MSKIPCCTGAELIAALKNAGFQVMRQRGSHVRLKDQEGRVVTVPTHPGKTLGKGLLVKILRDANISQDKLKNLLN